MANKRRSPDKISFIYRDRCHLCEEMAAALFRDWPMVAESLLWVNVDSAPGLQREYGMDIPVLTAGSKIICKHFLDRKRLTEYFGKPANPV